MAVNLDPPVCDRARALYASAIVGDNTIPWTGMAGDPNLREALPEKFRKAGVTYASLTLAADESDTLAAINTLGAERRYFQARADSCIIVETADDIERAKREGKLAVGFHFQGSVPAGKNLDMVEVFYKLGVRHILMAYNQKNFVADGCHELGDGGLSKFGHALVKEMNRVGMWVDVAHTGYRSSMDAIAASSAPVIVSHGNIWAINEHPRCYRDDQIKAIAETGGVFGLTGLGIFIGDNDASVAAFVRQIDYVVQRVGPTHVGFGLDYVYDMPFLTNMAKAHADKWPKDGGYTTPDLQQLEPEKLLNVTQGLIDLGYADADITAILGGNWVRLAREVWR